MINIILLSTFQTAIFALLGLAVITRLWKHSITTFMMIVVTGITTLLCSWNFTYALTFFIVGLTLMTVRAVLKPSDDKFIRWQK